MLLDRKKYGDHHESRLICNPSKLGCEDPGQRIPGPSICQQQPQAFYPKAFASTDSRVDTTEDVKFTGPNPCFFVFIRGSKIAPPRLDGRFTDVTRAQAPIRCDQPVLTQGLKDLRSHMPSRCDSETSFCRATSDWHSRLSHAVALRLYTSHIAHRTSHRD